MYQIEKGVEMERAGRPLGTWAVYPFGEMGPGDSFFVPKADKKTSSVRAATSAWAGRRGGHFRVAVVDGGSRVWRVS